MQYCPPLRYTRPDLKIQFLTAKNDIEVCGHLQPVLPGYPYRTNRSGNSKGYSRKRSVVETLFIAIATRTGSFVRILVLLIFFSTYPASAPFILYAAGGNQHANVRCQGGVVRGTAPAVVHFSALSVTLLFPFPLLFHSHTDSERSLHTKDCCRGDCIVP